MGTLIVLDLDNTLVDRDQTFAAWARLFAKEQNGTAEDEDWLRIADGDGGVPRLAFFERIKERFALSLSIEELLSSYWEKTFLSLFRCPEPTVAALERLRSNGYKLGIATNGGAFNQDAKIRYAGLDLLVDGWCISDVVGFHKPDAEIFALLAEACGTDLDGAWVVGDSAEHDIAGAEAIGARSIWMRRGRQWSESAFTPTFITETLADAAELILAHD